jgi:hypothetical protein
MKSIFAVCCSLIVAAATNAAVAGPFERGSGFRPFAQAQPSRPEPRREVARPVPQRDLRGSGDADRGRMNPDERRQLRRDIQDAGKDIYRRDRPPPQGRQQRR